MQSMCYSVMEWHLKASSSAASRGIFENIWEIITKKIFPKSVLKVKTGTVITVITELGL